MAYFNEFELYDKIREDFKYWCNSDFPHEIKIKYITEVYKAVKLFHKYGIVNDEQMKLAQNEACYYYCKAQGIECEIGEFE